MEISVILQKKDTHEQRHDQETKCNRKMRELNKDQTMKDLVDHTRSMGRGEWAQNILKL